MESNDTGKWKPENELKYLLGMFQIQEIEIIKLGDFFWIARDLK